MVDPVEDVDESAAPDDQAPTVDPVEDDRRVRAGRGRGVRHLPTLATSGARRDVTDGAPVEEFVPGIKVVPGDESATIYWPDFGAEENYVVQFEQADGTWKTVEKDVDPANLSAVEGPVSTVDNQATVENLKDGRTYTARIVSADTLVDAASATEDAVDLTPGGPRGAMARGLAITAAGDLAAAVASPPFTISPYKESLGNPELAAKCGLDFALVLDSSGSIGSTGIANLKSAANTFVDSLVDTGSSVSVVSFSTASPGTGTGTAPAPVNLAPTALTGANLTTIKNSYRNLRSNGSTNWQDGLAKSQDRFSFPAPGPGSTPGAPDLVVFITDGNPNTVGISPPTPSSQNASPDGSKAAVDPAIDLANAMKTSGVHMFGIAVGGNITLNPIRAITNQEELLANGSNFTTAGYTTTRDYAALAETLKQIAVELCAPSLTITKLAQKPGSAEYTSADGWSFATTVTIPGAAGKWVTPDKDDPILKNTPSTKSQVTSGLGAANFQWEPAGQFDSNVVISETQKPGFQRVSTLECSVKNVLAGTSRSLPCGGRRFRQLECWGDWAA